jgi:uncharacterized tellurite resistance protein B-like protein
MNVRQERGDRSDLSSMKYTAMLASLKTLISNIVSETKDSDRREAERCRVAIAALLVRVVSIDTDMSAARRAKLHSVLTSYFGYDEVVTTELIAQAAMAARDAVDLYHFTRPINLLVDDEGHRHIIRMMWEVIYADGGASPLENNLVWRIADLLGVPTRQRIELRRCIAVERGVSACSALSGP